MQTPKQIRVQTIITNVVPGTIGYKAKSALAALDAIEAAIVQIQAMRSKDEMAYGEATQAIASLREVESSCRKVFTKVLDETIEADRVALEAYDATLGTRWL